MAENNIKNVLDSLMKNVDGLVSSKTVIGEATTVGDAIIVPLVDVSVGVGAGSVRGDKKDSGAGGLSAKMSPSAVLVIQNGHTKMVSVKPGDTLSKVLDMIPEVIDKIKAKKEPMVDDEEAAAAAFPDEA